MAWKCWQGEMLLLLFKPIVTKYFSSYQVIFFFYRNSSRPLYGQQYRDKRSALCKKINVKSMFEFRCKPEKCVYYL
jgi:hypothetical protein